MWIGSLRRRIGSYTWIGLPTCRRALRRQAERQRLLRLAASPAYQDLVFTRSNGQPLRHEYVLGHLRQLTADADLPRIRVHGLRQDLIICDEVGFAPLDDTGAQLLFRVIAAAYERRALGIASHWPFEAWGRFLPEHTTAVSLLDRLLHHANVVVTDGESYRMREARARQPGGVPSS
jgi:IstB-like ATP binding protein